MPTPFRTPADQLRGQGYSGDIGRHGPAGGRQEHAAAIRGGAVLHPTATATTVRVTGARGGDVVTGDGPYEAADLDEQGPFPMETVYLWEDGPNGTTRMTL